jgi:hypothetical protein
MFGGFASKDDLCTLGFCIIDVFEDFLDCGGVD